MNTNKLEGMAATAATAVSTAATSMDSFIQAGNHLVQFVVTLLTLAWWVRIWIKKPKVQPPGDYVK